jgi:hypothetical protein
VAITQYIKVNQLGSQSSNSVKHFEFEARSGVHGDYKYECQGTSYFNVYEEGEKK